MMNIPANGEAALMPARDVMGERMRELKLIYPSLAAGITSDAAANARDRRALARMQIDIPQGPEAVLALEDACDIIFLHAFKELTDNNAGAAESFHDLISGALIANDMTPTMRKVVASMHRAISWGATAEEAMFTKQQTGSGRPVQTARDEEIRRFVRGQKSLDRFEGAVQEIDSIYDRASKIFGLSKKTIRNICAAKVL